MKDFADKQQDEAPADSGQIRVMQSAPSISGASDALIGSVLDDTYAIERLVARGGFARIYAARHRKLHRDVAVKLLDQQFYHQDSKTLSRLRQEARLCIRIDHPNVVKVYAFGATESGAYIVEELIAGKSLDDVLREQRSLGQERALNIFHQACAGVQAAHQEKIIHRDLKPANILLSDSPEAGETVKITDFGIARCLEQGQHLKLTQTGEFIGTLGYMSQEQLTGQELDERADVFALGCILYEMLTGQLLMQYENPMDLLRLDGSERVLQSNLPESLKQVIARAVSREKNDRYVTVADFAQAVTDVQSGGKPAAMPRRKAGFKLRPSVAVIALVGTASTIACLCAAIFIGSGKYYDYKFRKDLESNAPYSQISADFKTLENWLTKHDSHAQTPYAAFYEYTKKRYGIYSDECVDALIASRRSPTVDLKHFAEAALDVGEKAIICKNYSRAKKVAEIVFRGFPTDSDHWWEAEPIHAAVLIAEASYYLGDKQTAGDFATNVLKHSHQHWWGHIGDAYKVRGWVYRDADKFDKALDDHQRYTEILEGCTQEKFGFVGLKEKAKDYEAGSHDGKALATYAQMFSHPDWKRFCDNESQADRAARIYMQYGDYIRKPDKSGPALAAYQQAEEILVKNMDAARRNAVVIPEKQRDIAYRMGTALLECAIRLESCAADKEASRMGALALSLHQTLLPANNPLVEQERQFSKLDSGEPKHGL